MNVAISQVHPAQPEEWDVIWRQCDYATYFHSQEWAEIVSCYKEGKYLPNPLLVIFSDGKKALLALSCTMWECAGTSGQYFLSPVNGIYGGWIAADSLSREHAFLMKEFLTQKLGYLFWQINPFDDLVTATGVDATFNGETLVINLESGFDSVHKDWKASCRRAERKAVRSNIMVKVADKKEDWREYYRVYEDSFRRWGDQAQDHNIDWKIFQEMLFNRQSSHIKLWLATTKDELIVAGALMFYAKKHVYYFHGAALENYFALRPVNLLFYKIIKDACDKDYRWFDFGRSGSEGVRRFKRSFGARPMDCKYVDIRPESWDIV